MVIQIARMSAQDIHQSIYHCAVPQCGAPATWSLVDLAMPLSNAANLGERPCCSNHISAVYLSLRGAHLVARAPAATRASEYRPSFDRRRRKRRLVAQLGAVLNQRAG